MKLIKLLSISAILSIFSLTFTSCSDDDDPTPVHEEEVITTMNVVLTDASNNKITLQSKDLDGDGPNEPVITSGTLNANTTYSGVITLLNETEETPENITEEVAEEADEHQFFYNATGISSEFSYAGEKDADGNPVGIKFTIKTGNAGKGTYVITLRHEPNKSADGVKEGNIKNAGGSTDFEAIFPITIQAKKVLK